MAPALPPPRHSERATTVGSAIGVLETDHARTRTDGQTCCAAAVLRSTRSGPAAAAARACDAAVGAAAAAILYARAGGIARSLGRRTAHRAGGAAGVEPLRPLPSPRSGETMHAGRPREYLSAAAAAINATSTAGRSSPCATLYIGGAGAYCVRVWGVLLLAARAARFRTYACATVGLISAYQPFGNW